MDRAVRIIVIYDEVFSFRGFVSDRFFIDSVPENQITSARKGTDGNINVLHLFFRKERKRERILAERIAFEIGEPNNDLFQNVAVPFKA